MIVFIEALSFRRAHVSRGYQDFLVQDLCAASRGDPVFRRERWITHGWTAPWWHRLPDGNRGHFGHICARLYLPVIGRSLGAEMVTALLDALRHPQSLQAPGGAVADSMGRQLGEKARPVLPRPALNGCLGAGDDTGGASTRPGRNGVCTPRSAMITSPGLARPANEERSELPGKLLRAGHGDYVINCRSACLYAPPFTQSPAIRLLAEAERHSSFARSGRTWQATSGTACNQRAQAVALRSHADCHRPGRAVWGSLIGAEIWTSRGHTVYVVKRSMLRARFHNVGQRRKWDTAETACP